MGYQENKIYVSYIDAKPFINEADVLLFRGSSWASYFISRASKSSYTHVGLASWVYEDNTAEGILECVEFKEGGPVASLFNKNAGGGGRAVNLWRQVEENPGKIDVYRPVTFCSEWKLNVETLEPTLERREINSRTVTKTMRKMTGLPYGWQRIWWIAKHNLAFFRLFMDTESLQLDTVSEIVYPVCSTAVSYSFNSNGYDLTKNKSDDWTEPGDIAQSPRLSYLFTLDP